MEKILVIEDDLAVQRALRRTFESAGFEVTIAADGGAAMEMFRATVPRVVILDLRLPGKSGQDICREIKREASNVPILVLVSDGERALLGRQASWPARRYSTIAGFVEPGESLEDAVRREVAEETGTTVTSVRYDSSQPWPFPASVMLGFRASASADSPVRASGELEDARWFTRGQLTSGEVLAPPSQAISWRLIEGWLKGAS